MEVIGGRRIRSVEKYLHLFPRPLGNDIVIKKSADVGDTVRFIQEKVPKAAWQTEKFARFVKGRSTDETCEKIWQWLFDHIPYKKDEEGVEQIRSPRRLVYEGSKTGVDCDCYSFTISCTLWILNIRHKYRIAKYERLDGSAPRWQHIYIVVPKSGKLDSELSEREDYIVIDCVKNGYDSEEPYLECKDYNADMRLDYLDGLEQEEFKVPGSVDAQDLADMYDEEDLGKIGQWVKKSVKNVGKTVKKGFQAVKKVGGSPLRNSFLLAMKVNFFNVAKRLRYAYLSDEQARKMGLNLSALARLRKIREKAENIFAKAGGKKDNVKLAILKGKGNKDRKVALAGIDMLYGNLDEEEYAIISGLGELGVIASAALASVTPIFKALADALKQAKDLFPKNSAEGQNFESDTEPDMPAISQADVTDSSEESIISTPSSTALIPSADPATHSQIQKSSESLAPADQSQDTASSQSPEEKSTEVPATTNNSPPAEGFFSKAGAWIKKNPLPTVLIVAGVGTGIYLLTRQSSPGLSGLPSQDEAKQKKRRKAKKKRPGTRTEKFKPVKIR